MRKLVVFSYIFALLYVQGDEISDSPLSRGYVKEEGRGFYLVYQNFEGAGTDEDAFETWTEVDTSGQLNLDYSADPLLDLESLDINNTVSSASYLRVPFTPVTYGDTTYFYGMFKMPTALPGSSIDLASFRHTAGGTNVLRVRVTAGGLLNITHGGSGNVSTGSAMAVNTLYHIWFDYKPASGGLNNGVYSCTFNTVGVKSTGVTRAMTTGNGTGPADMLQI
jgi:hypothetical protein